MTDPPEVLSSRIKKEALSLGFDLVGITAYAELEKGGEAISAWVREGRHGGMKYLEDFDARKSRFLEGFSEASSVIVLGVNYYQAGPVVAQAPFTGRVARYAWGRDYHQVIGEKHQILMTRMRDFCGTDFKAKSCVDTQPVPEKFAASRAGLGFMGKNTLLLSEKFGPWLFLSEIITNLKLFEDPADSRNCGTCKACQEVCPTGALDQDYKIDARLCIAYLTIEHKGVIPRELRSKMKDWVFGCDECLTGCPFDAKAKQSSWQEFTVSAGSGPGIKLPELFEIRSNLEYEKKFSGSAILRAGRKQMLRNACIVLGNSESAEVIPYLEHAMKDPSSLVRLHAAWALGKIPYSRAGEVLETHLAAERDPEVLEEIKWALTSRKK